MNFGEDYYCFWRYLKILFLPTMRLESSWSLPVYLYELSGIPKCPDVFAFFSSLLLAPKSYRSLDYCDGSLR